MPDRLLHPAFERLRSRDVPLGIPEYTEAVEAFREGLFLDSAATDGDLERLRRMLRLLWAKSREHLALVDAAFEEYIAPKLRPPKVAGERAIEEGSDAEAQDSKESETLRILRQEARRGKGGAAGGGETNFQGTPISTDAVFRLTPKPPVGLRRAMRTLRPLRRLVRRGASPEPDIPATIDRVCREGYLIRPEMKPRRVNLSALWVLADFGGSMTPFSPALDPILEALTAEHQSGRLQIGFRYFHDCPEDGLFATPNLAEPVHSEDFFSALSRTAAVLFVGDAGAARGDYDGRRVAETRRFIERANGASWRMAWVNPVPASRWPGSSAGEIAEMIPMFFLDRQGLEAAVAALRGGRAAP